MKMKRCLGILICFALMLGMTITSYAEYAAPESITIGDNIAFGTDTDRNGEGWSYVVSGDTRTLTLNNFSYSGDSTCILYRGSKPLNIFLIGTNSITTRIPTDGIHAAPNVNYANCDLVFSGSGSLNVKSSGTAGNAGIAGTTKITIDGGTIISEGSTGIKAIGDFTINGGSVTVTATGENGCGIDAYRDIIINGGSVTATSTGENGYGIKSSSLLSIGSGVTSVVAIGPTCAIEATVKNDVSGTGWTDTSGTEGKATIAVNTGQGQQLAAYKKVQFPGVPAAKVTTEPKARTLSFTGTAQELVKPGSTKEGTLYYALGENETTAPAFDGTSQNSNKVWNTSIPAVTNVGTYHVWYMILGDASHIDSDPKHIPAKINVRYYYTSGEGSTWTKNSDMTLGFHIESAGSDADILTEFGGIKVDGNPVSQENYNAGSGSVKIELKADYLETLNVGEHKLTAVFDNGSADAKFTIVKSPVNPSIVQSPVNPSGLPQTGDNSNILIFVAVGTAALAGLAFVIKKKI